jgi:hypothetical protein
VLPQDPSGDVAPRRRNHRSRSKPVGQLKRVLPHVGRAAAGVASAAKRKAQARQAVEEGLRKLEGAALGSKPDLGQVARAAGVSTATVRRHCNENPEFAARLSFGPKVTRSNEKARGLAAMLTKAELVIVEQSLEIRQLREMCKEAQDKCRILEDRLNSTGLEQSTFESMQSPKSTRARSLRLVSSRKPGQGIS